MRPLRLLASLAGWAGFGVVLGVLVALGAGPRPAVAVERPAPAGPPPEPEPARRRSPARHGRAVRAAPPAGALVVAPDDATFARGRFRTCAARTVVRLLANVAGALAAGLVLGLLLALTLPLAFGMRPLVVMSGSMEPVLHVGDVVVVQRIAPRDARVGDVVTYKAPVSGRVTTHRLRAVRRDGPGRFAFTTKGDANNAIERWTLAADGQLSRAVYRVPLVGAALLTIRTPLGWALLVGLPLLVLGAQEIVRIWRPLPERGDAPATA